MTRVKGAGSVDLLQELMRLAPHVVSHLSPDLFTPARPGIRLSQRLSARRPAEARGFVIIPRLVGWIEITSPLSVSGVFVSLRHFAPPPPGCESACNGAGGAAKSEPADNSTYVPGCHGDGLWAHKVRWEL